LQREGGDWTAVAARKSIENPVNARARENANELFVDVDIAIHEMQLA
jgi:hypothetical protein